MKAINQFVFFILLGIVVSCAKKNCSSKSQLQQERQLEQQEKNIWVHLLKMFDNDVEKVKKIEKAYKKEVEKNRKNGPEELAWVDDGLPSSIKDNPRVFFGKQRNPFIQKGDFEEIIFGGVKFKYDRKKSYLYSLGPVESGSKAEKELEEFQKRIRSKLYFQVEYKVEGTYALKANDITVDVGGDADLLGNAWEPEIISQLKNKLKNKKPKAIIFERISLMPLYFGDYIKACLKMNGVFYEMNYNGNENLNFYSKSKRVIKKVIYRDTDKKFYPKVNPVKFQLNITDINPHAISCNKQPNIYIKHPFNGDIAENEPIEDLEEILKRKIYPEKNYTLDKYFELLAPGGKVILMTSSCGLHRHGGVVFKYKNKPYSPFKNLDDKNLKNLYIDIFKRSGFENIRFYKDKYYEEDVLCIEGYKPYSY